MKAKRSLNGRLQTKETRRKHSKMKIQNKKGDLMRRSLKKGRGEARICLSSCWKTEPLRKNYRGSSEGRRRNRWLSCQRRDWHLMDWKWRKRRKRSFVTFWMLDESPNHVTNLPFVSTILPLLFHTSYLVTPPFPVTQLPLPYPNSAHLMCMLEFSLKVVFDLIGQWVQPTKSLAWEFTNFSYTWSVQRNGTLARVARNLISIVKSSWLFYLRNPNTFNAQWSKLNLFWRFLSEGVGWDSKIACFPLSIAMRQRT